MTKILPKFSTMVFLFSLLILAWQTIHKITSNKLVILLLFVVLIANIKAK